MALRILYSSSVIRTHPFTRSVSQKFEIVQIGGEAVSAEEKKQEMQEVVTELQGLSRDDLMKTWGFALGLKAQEEHHPG
jgi:hypothetical protein